MTLWSKIGLWFSATVAKHREKVRHQILQSRHVYIVRVSVRAHSLVVYPLSVLFPVDRGASDYVMISSHFISTIKIQGFQSMSINL